VQRLEDENDAATCCLRICGFLLHFAAYYGMLYPLIMLIGMIPLIGAVGATILVFIAFFLACCSFLFIIACAWICARPLFAIFIFTIIGILIVAGKIGRDKLKEEGYIQDKEGGQAARLNSSENGKPKVPAWRYFISGQLQSVVPMSGQANSSSNNFLAF